MSVSVQTTNYGSECGAMCRDPDCVPCLQARAAFLERQLECVTREHDRLRNSLFRVKAAWGRAADEITDALNGDCDDVSRTVAAGLYLAWREAEETQPQPSSLATPGV